VLVTLSGGGKENLRSAGSISSLMFNYGFILESIIFGDAVEGSNEVLLAEEPTLYVT